MGLLLDGKRFSAMKENFQRHPLTQWVALIQRLRKQRM
jgi:hypothetical protein